MSQFLPEPAGATPAIAPGTDAQPSEADIQLAARVVAALAARPQQLISPLMSYIADAIGISNLLLPISQIIGFAQFTAAYESVAALQTTTSTSYTDLATVGPTLNGLPDGQYVVISGTLAKSSVAGTGVQMSYQVNAVAASDSDRAYVEIGNFASAVAARKKTLAGGGNNTITAKYRVVGGPATASFADRWILAFKFANA